MNIKSLAAIILLYLFTINAYAEQEIVSYRLSAANGLPNNNIRNISVDRNGMIFFSSHYMTYAFDGYTFRLLDKTDARRPQENASKETHGMRRDNMGNMYKVNLDGTIDIHDRKTSERTHLQIFSPDLLKISTYLKIYVITDHKGLIWISVFGNGIFVYDKKRKELRHITKNDADQLIDSNGIVCLAMDSCGNIWASQEHMGLVCLKMTEKDYTVKRIDNSNEKTRNIRMMQRINDNGDIIFCNNAAGLYMSDRNLATIKKVGSDKNILTAMKDSRGRLLLGSRQDGVGIEGKWSCKGRVESIVEDRKGRIWACGLHNGLYVAPNDTSGFIQVIRGMGLRKMAKDRASGNIFIASDSGLIHFNPDRLLADSKDYKIILKEHCRTVYISSRNDIWVGTPDRGVLVRKAGKGVFQRFTYNDGITSNAVSFITENRSGDIVIGTENGLSSFHGGRFHKVFTARNLLNSFCNEEAYAWLKDGRIAIGTLDGIVIVRTTAQTSPRHEDAAFSVSDIIANGASVYYSDGMTPMEDMESNGTLTLEHDVDNLTFHFSTFDFTERDRTDYSYMLEGYDDDWSPASTLNIASYKKLKPGSYRFRVRRRNANGDWIEASEIKNVIILPPWWATWWAYLIYAAVLSAVALVIRRQIVNTMRLEQSIEKEKWQTEFKLRFFTDISHEFRTPLTLILNSIQRIKAVNGDIPGTLRQPLYNMQRDVERMMRLTNQLLEFRKMHGNKLSLSLQETDVVPFLYNIWISFHETAENKGISYRFVPQGKSIMAPVDRGHLDKIVYNLLSNAFKYTPNGGSVELTLGIYDNMLRISVADTGIGIPHERRQEIFERFSTGKVNADGIGIGLHLTAELVRTHHGSITLGDNQPKGSVFSVSLPIDKAVYSEEDYMREIPELDNGTVTEKQGFSEAHQETHPVPMNDIRVLVVDDTPEVCDMIVREAGRYFRAERASDGQEALDKLMATGDSDKAFELVISDVRMPNMDGFELTRRIRKDNRLMTLPVILLTSLTDDNAHIRGLEAGADAYITKPFSTAVLISQCATLLKRQKMLASTQSTAVSPVGNTAVKDIVRSEKNMKFIKLLEAAVYNRMSDTSLNVDTLAESFGMGRTTFYAKVKTLTGRTPNEYINDTRLEAVAGMLRNTSLSISEIAYKTGFSSPQYLARSFKKRFGMSPTEYAGK